MLVIRFELLDTHEFCEFFVLPTDSTILLINRIKTEGAFAKPNGILVYLLKMALRCYEGRFVSIFRANI